MLLVFQNIFFDILDVMFIFLFLDETKNKIEVKVVTCWCYRLVNKRENVQQLIRQIATMARAATPPPEE